MAEARGEPAGVVVTRTPLRVSFGGGGTDLPAFYEREAGAVLSTTIDKYVYVTLKRHSGLFREAVRLNYSETEHVEAIEDVQNDIARECLRFMEVKPPIYVSTVADIPAASGLGSSSAFGVGLLNALHVFRGEYVSAGQLAEEAARVEIEILKRPIGKQDHMAAAFGGFNLLRFLPDGGVSVEPQRFGENVLQSLFAYTLVFWTGMSRDAGVVLKEQQRNTSDKFAELASMREHALEMQSQLRGDFEPIAFGKMLDETWRAKRQLAGGISNVQIDTWHDRALDAGAIGGKVCGAGGGGFLLFIVPPDRQADVRRALGDMVELPVAYEPRGSRVMMPHAE